VSRADSLVDYEILEHYVRQDLNSKAPRTMAVLDPIKVKILNYPENK